MNEYAKLSKGAKPDPQFARYLNEFLKARKDKNNLKALDLGCGSLRNSNHFAESGFRVLAIDIDKDLPKYYKELPLSAQDKINIKVGDICKLFDFLKENAPFDFILALHTLSFLPKDCVFKLFEILPQITNKNAQIYINFWGKEDSFVKNSKAVGYDKSELKAELEKHKIKILKLEERKFEGKTISGHPKFWHIISISLESV